MVSAPRDHRSYRMGLPLATLGPRLEPRWPEAKTSPRVRASCVPNPSAQFVHLHTLDAKIVAGYDGQSPLADVLNGARGCVSGRLGSVRATVCPSSSTYASSRPLLNGWRIRWASPLPDRQPPVRTANTAFGHTYSWVKSPCAIRWPSGARRASRHSEWRLSARLTRPRSWAKS